MVYAMNEAAPCCCRSRSSCCSSKCCCNGECCCSSTPQAAAGTTEPAGAAAAAAAAGRTKAGAAAAHPLLGRRVVEACQRTKKVPLLTAAVEEAVSRCCCCSCWEAAAIPPEQRSLYCCLCMQSRKRNDCIFWASPWTTNFRTFAAFSDPNDAAAAAAEQHAIRETSQSSSSSSREYSSKGGGSSSLSTGDSGSAGAAAAAAAAATAASAADGGRKLHLFFLRKLWGLMRAAVPLALMISVFYYCCSMSGPLPQVLLLVGLFFSCIPLGNAVAALVRLREERLTIIGDFGVQWNFRRLFGASSRFVAMSQIQDVFISEEVHVYRIAYHVVLVVGDKQELIVPFQDFELRLEDCLAVYEALHYLLRTQMRFAKSGPRV